jgi:dihydroxyacetone kinase-like predicted kinase
MSDDSNKQSFQDASRININEVWEVEFWIKKLQVTKEKLKEAVKTVGSSVAAVQKYLQKK